VEELRDALEATLVAGVKSDATEVVGKTVEILGTSREQLNGQRALVESFDEKKGRYNCRVGGKIVGLKRANFRLVEPSNSDKADAVMVTDAPEAAVHSSTSTELEIGTLVVCHGLSRVEMNGQLALVLTSLDAERERHDCLLLDGKKKVGLKPINLKRWGSDLDVAPCIEDGDVKAQYERGMMLLDPPTSVSIASKACEGLTLLMKAAAQGYEPAQEAVDMFREAALEQHQKGAPSSKTPLETSMAAARSGRLPEVDITGNSPAQLIDPHWETRVNLNKAPPDTFGFTLGKRQGICCVLPVSEKVFDLMLRVHAGKLPFSALGEYQAAMAELQPLLNADIMDYMMAMNLITEYARRFSKNLYTFRRATRGPGCKKWTVVPGGRMFDNYGGPDTKHCGNNTLVAGTGGKHHIKRGSMAGSAFNFCPRGCVDCVDGPCKHPTRIWCRECDLTPWCSMECKREHHTEHKGICDAAKKIRKLIGFDRVCHQCGIQETKASEKLRVCGGGCGQALYCSKECQTAAWYAGHKLECTPRPTFETDEQTAMKAKKKAKNKKKKKKKASAEAPTVVGEEAFAIGTLILCHGLSRVEMNGQLALVLTSLDAERERHDCLLLDGKKKVGLKPANLKRWDESCDDVAPDAAAVAAAGPAKFLSFLRGGSLFAGMEIVHACLSRAQVLCDGGPNELALVNGGKIEAILLLAAFSWPSHSLCLPRRCLSTASTTNSTSQPA